MGRPVIATDSALLNCSRSDLILKLPVLLWFLLVQVLATTINLFNWRVPAELHLDSHAPIFDPVQDNFLQPIHSMP